MAQLLQRLCMQESGLKILFAINPISGGKKKEDHETTIREFFKGKPEQIECFLMDGNFDQESMDHWISSWKPDKVVAVGGDGTVSMVAKSLLNSGIPLGILPAGSANGMAAELQLPTDLVAALKIVEGNYIQPCDVLEINNTHFCLHLSDIGLNAKLIRYFEEGSIRGMFGYAKVAYKVLLKKRMLKITVKTKGNHLEREALMAILANARKYGTGAVINPDGILDDGLFEVILIKKLALSEIIKAFINHGRFNPKKFEILQADSISIQTNHAADFQVDGEYLVKIRQLDAKVLPSELQILVTPPDTKDTVA
ncbi:MAG TPA: diacylglycerol kinase family protein [Flavitalea sp.]|nr:diacylglycerol kinase family protein [Flavitalea sp.]